MTQGDGILETLRVIFEADVTQLRTGMQQAQQVAATGGQQTGRQFSQGLQTVLSGAGMGGIGQQAGQQLANGFTTDVNGRIRNARGQFVASGTQAGQAIGQGVSAGLTSGLGQANTQITGLTSRLGQMGQSGTGIFTALSRGVQASGLLGQLGGLGGGLGSVINGMGGVAMAGGPVVAAIGGVTAAVGASAIAINKATNEYAAYEYQLAKISTLSDKTGRELGGVGQSLKEMSRETGKSLEDLSDGMYDVLGASVKGADDLNASLGLVRISAKLATAGFTDASVATDVLTSVINSYKLSASDAQSVADRLFATVDVGKISFKELANSLGMVTSFSATAGVSLNEVLAAIASMTANGVQGGQSIEYLRTMLGNIVAPSAQAKKMAHDLTIEFDAQALKSKGLTAVLRDVMEATDGNAGKLKVLFGDVGAVAAATAIATGNFERMDSSLRAVTNSTGAADTAYAKVADTAKHKSEEVAASWKTLWINVGEIFAPFKLNFMTEVGEMLSGVNKLLEKMAIARKPQQAADNVAALEADLAAKREYLAGGRAIIANPPSGKIGASLAEDWATRRLPNTLREIAELEAKIAAAKKEQAQAAKDLTAYNLANATSALPAGMQGPQLPGFNKTQAVPKTGEEAGRFGYAFFEQMFKSGSVRGNPNIAAWCADVASQIQKNLGNDIKYTASAGGLKENAIAAGYQKVTAAEARPGDLVFYRDPNVYGGRQANGLRSGNHVETVARNDGGKITLFGANNTRTPTFKDFYDSAHATFYRAPTSPFAAGGEGTGGGNKPAPMVTAEQIAQAQRLTDALTAAKKARDDNPGVAKFVQGVVAADRALTAFSKASAGNAEALKALGSQSAKTGSTYLASAAEIAKYGTSALLLVKDLETAEKSGSAISRAAAQARVNAWIGEDKARKSVFDLESRAYSTRQQLATKAATEDKSREEARATLSRQVSTDIAAGRVKDAQATLTKLKGLQSEELADAGQNQAQRAAIIERTSPQILNAEKAINARVRDQGVQAAQSWANEQKALGKLTGEAIETERKRRVAVAYADEARSNAQAQQEQSGVVKGAARDRADYEKKMGENRQAAERALAAGQVEVAKKSAQQVIDEYDRQVKAAGDDATKRLMLEQRLGADVLAARNALATATAQGEKQRLEQERNAEMNKEGITKVQRTQIWEQYATRIAQVDKSLQTTLQGNAEETTRTLNAAVEASVQLQIDAQTRLNASTIEGMRKRQEATDQMERAAQAALDAGEADAARLVAGIEAHEAAMRSLEKTASDGVASDAQALSQTLMDLGDTEGAMNALTTALGNVMDRAQQGQDAAGAVDVLTLAVNNLAEALGIEDEFNLFVAQLGGTLEDQITQVVEKLASSTDLKLKGKLTAYLASLRQQVPTYNDPYAAGYIPGPNGFVGQTDSPDMTALTAATLRLTLETEDGEPLDAALLEAANLLASEAGKALPQGVQDGLRAAIEGAQAYKDALASITGEAVADGASVALSNAGRQGEPENLFAEKQGQLYAMGAAGDLANPVKLAAVRDGLKQLRDEGKLTDEQLIDLNATIEQLTTDNTVEAAPPFDFDGWAEDIGRLKKGLEEGTLTAAQARPIFADYATRLEEAAVAAEKAGNPVAARRFRDMAKALAEATPEAQKLKQSLDDLAKVATGFEKLSNAVAGLFKSFGGTGAADIASGLGSAFSGITKMKGAINEAKDAWKAFSKEKSAMNFGDLLSSFAGVVGVVGQVIDGVLSIGNAIEGLSPSLREWKKQLLEIANLEKEAMGSKSYGNIANPYYSTLDQDAANREKLASSNWLQRLGWSIFGGAPEVMSDSAAQLTASAAQIFGDMAQTIAQTLDSSLMNAFETGDWTGTEEAFSKSLNTMIAKMTLQAIIASSKIGDKIKEYSDARAKAMEDGSISTAEQAELDRLMGGINSERQSITEQWKATAPGLAGYGQNAEDKPGKGSIAALQDDLSKLQDKYNKATDQATRDALKLQIDSLNAQIKALQGERDTSLEQSQLKALQDINQLREKLAQTTDEKTRISLQAQIDDLTRGLGDLGSIRIQLPAVLDPAAVQGTLQLDLLGSLSETVKIYVPQFALGIQDYGAHTTAFGGHVGQFGSYVGQMGAVVDRFDRMSQQKERDWSALRPS